MLRVTFDTSAKRGKGRENGRFRNGHACCGSICVVYRSILRRSYERPRGLAPARIACAWDDQRSLQ